MAVSCGERREGGREGRADAKEYFSGEHDFAQLLTKHHFVSHVDKTHQHLSVSPFLHSHTAGVVIPSYDSVAYPSSAPPPYADTGKH